MTSKTLIILLGLTARRKPSHVGSREFALAMLI